MPERKLSERTALWVALAGIVGAVVGAGITGGFNYLSHQHDLDAKMIELSVGILSAKAVPTDENKRLRKWAVDVMQTRAHFKFDDALREDLIKGYAGLPETEEYTGLPATRRPSPAPR
jgi:hypothetical protein